MNLKETYNRIAEDWHRNHQKDDWWAGGTDKFISFLQKGDLALDVGCGAGTKSKYLIKKGLRVIGVDFSEKMIEIAKREIPNGNFFVFDLSEIDKLDYLFNGIFMQAVLLHIPKRKVKDKLEKVITKLKTGGYIYIAVKEKKSQGVEEEIKIENDYGYQYERFFSYFTVDEIKLYLQNLGIKIVFSEIKSPWIQIIGRK